MIIETSDFNYDLDESFATQHLISPRDYAKLMLISRNSKDLQYRVFYEILDELKLGDVMVVSDTRVRPARLYDHRKGKEEEIEALLLKLSNVKIRECLVRPGKKMKADTGIYLQDLLKGTVIGTTEGGSRHISFEIEGNEQDIEKVFEQTGQMPLPPYIKEKLDRQEEYQTVYFKYIGSAAVPTAGLHFTRDLLEKVEKKKVKIVPITLHVGLGTFRPASVDNVESHHIHSELCMASGQAVEETNKTKAGGRRIIAVRTTSTRTLESMAEDGKLTSGHKWTDVFIYSGFHSQIVDGPITNFHLPRLTLSMLASVFSSKEIILHVYEEVKKNSYRFFSSGDAMLIRKGD